MKIENDKEVIVGEALGRAKCPVCTKRLRWVGDRVAGDYKADCHDIDYVIVGGHGAEKALCKVVNRKNVDDVPQESVSETQEQKEIKVIGKGDHKEMTVEYDLSTNDEDEVPEGLKDTEGFISEGPSDDDDK